MAFLLQSLLFIGCGDLAAFERDSDDTPDAEQEKKDLVPVEVEALNQGSIESVLRFSTNLEAENEVQVFSQAARQVTQLLVEEGDRVRKGQPLVRLQDDQQKGALARAESQLAKAKREFERQQNLFAKELISEQAMNDSTYEVEQMELALDDAKRELSYTEVRAPISGTVTARLVNLGDTITVNQHLFDLVDFDSIVARIFVPEKDLPKLYLKQPARLWAQGVDAPRDGQIIRISPVVDPQSGTIKATVGIPANQQVRPGQYVEVELVTAKKDDALLVPKRALVYDDTQIFVFRLADSSDSDTMTVERLELEVAVEDRRFVEPASGQLEVGDRLVIAGQAGLKEGTKVRLAETERGLSGSSGGGLEESAEVETPEAGGDEQAADSAL